MPNRVVMHVDLDYFYAQCEENRHPDKRGKPVVVCVYSGRTEESGVVSTANYPARKYGVKAGVPITRAKKLLESVDATFLPMNRPLYEQVSDRIMEILKANSDSFEKMGIDEGYLDISTKVNGNYKRAEETAIDVKREVLTQEHITCSIGLAPNKLIAKIASDEKKPDGLTIVRPEDVDSFLQQMPVSRIPGVGRKVEDKLAQLHVEIIPQLSAVNPSILVETFGKSLGAYLFKAARGEDEDPVKERGQPTQLSRIATLKQNTREPSEIEPLLDELTKSVADKLKERNMRCRSIAIIAILTDLSTHTKSKTLESPTSDATILKSITNELMAQLLESSPSAIIRRAGVRVSDLSNPSGQTDISNFLTA